MSSLGDVHVPHGSTDGTINAGKVTAGKIANGAVTEAKVGTGAVTSGKIGTGAVTEAKIASGAVTGPKLGAAFKRAVVTGRNGAGACTLTGARVGDVVVGIVNLTDEADASASFEATITVADQIQQSSATNLTTKHFDVLLIVKS